MNVGPSTEVSVTGSLYPHITVIVVVWHTFPSSVLSLCSVVGALLHMQTATRAACLSEQGVSMCEPAESLGAQSSK